MIFIGIWMRNMMGGLNPRLRLSRDSFVQDVMRKSVFAIVVVSMA